MRNALILFLEGLMSLTGSQLTLMADLFQRETFFILMKAGEDSFIIS